MDIRAGLKLLAFALVVATTACGPPPKPAETRAQVLERYRTQLEAKKQELITAFQPEDPSAVRLGLVPGEPKPFLSSRHGYIDGGNVGILPATWLFNGEDPEVDLGIESPLRDALRLLNPPGWMDLTSTADDDLGARIEAALATNYVALYTVEEYTEPKALPDNKFARGALKVMIGLMDIKNNSLLASCRAWASNGDKLDFTELRWQPEGQAAENAAYDELLQNTREKVGVCLAGDANGEFDLKF